MTLPIDEQIADKLRGLIRHFKQDDPRGIPSEMGDVVKDPMPIPNLEKTFSGTKMKFEDLLMHGLSTFRLDYARALISDLKVCGFKVIKSNVQFTSTVTGLEERLCYKRTKNMSCQVVRIIRLDIMS